MSDFFDIGLYKHHLSTELFGDVLLIEKQIPSTNSALKARRDTPGESCHGLVLLAEHQTRGRGQHNREWISSPGKNLTFSLQVCPDRSERLLLLSLCMASSIRQVLNAIDADVRGRVSVKWPNDVLIDGRKVAGILTEGVFQGHKLEKVILGVGVNVHQSPGANNLDPDKTTSIHLETHRMVSREWLLASILNHFEEMYLQWESRSDILYRTVSHELDGFGRWVHVEVDGILRKDPVKFLGVNEYGSCLMLNEELNVDTFTHEQIRIITGREVGTKAS